MPLLVNLALLATLGAAYEWRAQPARFWLILASGLAIIVIIVVTLAVDVPINRRIQRWSPDAAPGDWMAQRDRWMRSNDIRTIVAILALALLLGGVALAW